MNKPLAGISEDNAIGQKITPLKFHTFVLNFTLLVFQTIFQPQALMLQYTSCQEGFIYYIYFCRREPIITDQ